MTGTGKKTSLHETIGSDIRGRILSGAWMPGQKVPSEAELMAQYGCSRMTVNKALSALAAAGLVERRKRAGTIVARRTGETLLLDVPDLRAETEARGAIYAWHLIAAETVRPSRALAQRLGIRDSGKMLHIRGSHHADGVGFAFEDRYVNLAAVPDMAQGAGNIDLTREAPGSWLLRHIPWTEAEHRIRAVSADADCAQALAVSEGSACLVMERRTWRGPLWVTYVRQYFPEGRHELIARFGPSGTARG